MVECVEELGAEFQALRFCQPEFLAKFEIKHILSGSNQAVARSVAKVVRVTIIRIDYMKSIDIEPMVWRAIAARQVTVPELIGTRDTLRAGIEVLSVP